MISKVIGLLLLGAVSLPTLAADIYRWTDDTGRVNYGNSVPDRFKHVARRIDTDGPFVADAQRQAAAAREKAQAEAAASSSSSVGSSSQPGSAGSGSAGY